MTTTTDVPSIPAELFDCVQVNAAVLARRLHGPGAELALGACLRFRPRPGPGGLPTVEPDPAAELARCAAAAGLTILASEHADPARVTPGPGCLVVADAFALPWLPYAGHRHLDHGFLVDEAGPSEIGGVDAYHTDTPWGPARPGRWRMSRDEFAALPGPVLVTTFGPGEHPAPGPSADLAAPEEIDAYAGAYARHPDRQAAWERLTLETWLLGRSRQLHAAHLRARGRTVPDEHLEHWRSLVEQVFVGARRVERGRAEPSGAFDRLRELLHADRDAFGDGLRDAVAATVAAVLDVDAGALAPDRPLTDVAAVDSFRLVQLMERIEAALDVEFDPDLLVPENFADVDTIVRVLVRPARAGGPAQA